MFTCPRCSCNYLVGSGWQPPPCLFSTADDLFQLPELDKCFFTHIECLCGQHIGVKVISGPAHEIGYWRLQFDALEMSEVEKEVILLPEINLTKQDLKFIFEKQLTNIAFEVAQVQKKNRENIFMIERLLKFSTRSRGLNK